MECLTNSDGGSWCQSRHSANFCLRCLTLLCALKLPQPVHPTREARVHGSFRTDKRLRRVPSAVDEEVLGHLCTVRWIHTLYVSADCFTRHAKPRTYLESPYPSLILVVSMFSRHKSVLPMTLTFDDNIIRRGHRHCLQQGEPEVCASVGYPVLSYQLG